MEGRYRRTQRARLLSLSTPFDTCVLLHGYLADIYSETRSRRVDRLADELRGEGKIVRVFHHKYTPERQEGWEVEA